MRSSRFTCFRVIVELLHERVLNFCVYCLGPAPKLVDPAIVAGPKMAAHRCATLYCSAHGRVSGWSRGYNCHFNKELNLLFNCLPGTARDFVACRSYIVSNCGGPTANYYVCFCCRSNNSASSTIAGHRCSTRDHVNLPRNADPGDNNVVFASSSVFLPRRTLSRLCVFLFAVTTIGRLANRPTDRAQDGVSQPLLGSNKSRATIDLV